MLVEDDEGVKELLATALRQHKYSVVECSNGETALAKFERSKSNIIICVIDIELPDIEGPNLVKKLLLKKSNINVLFISGYDEIKLKQKFPLINHTSRMNLKCSTRLNLTKSPHWFKTWADSKQRYVKLWLRQAQE